MGFDSGITVVSTKENETTSSESMRHGMSVEAVKKLVEEFDKNYRGNIPLRYIIADKQEDIYGVENSRENIGQRWQGTYHPRENFVSLIASNLDNEEAVRRTLRHEVLGHYGLNTFKPYEKRSFLFKVLDTRTEPSLKRHWQHVDKAYSELPELLKAEEVFAFVSEETDFYSKAWDKVRTGFQQLLRKTGLANETLKDFELRDSARALASGIRKGRLLQQNFPGVNSLFSKTIDETPISKSAERAAWGNFPDVVRNGELKSLEREPEYAAAKSGDRSAALSLIDRLMKNEFLDGIRKKLNGEMDFSIVPVVSEESTGRNKIPIAIAMVLESRLGGKADLGIVQTTRVNRTGSSADHRLAFNPIFKGQVEPSRKYLIVDDTLSMGGTVAALRGFITNRGGLVEAAAVMTAHEGALRLPVQPEMLSRIENKHGSAMNQFWKEEFGYDIDKLTQAEAGHLRAAESVDAIRTRIFAARSAAGWRMDAQGTGKEENPKPTGHPEIVVPLASIDDYRSSQLTRSKQSMESTSAILWDADEKFRTIHQDIIQQGVDPERVLLGEIDEFSTRIREALEANPSARALQRTWIHAYKRYEKQNARFNRSITTSEFEHE